MATVPPAPSASATLRRVLLGAAVGALLLAGSLPSYPQVEGFSSRAYDVSTEAGAMAGSALLEKVALGMSESLPRMALLEGVAARLAGCTGPMGVKETLPLAVFLPPLAEMVGSMHLRASSGIHDGYTQVLHLHGPSNSAYLVQRGGFDGSEAVYGPLSMHDTCKPIRYTWK